MVRVAHFNSEFVIIATVPVTTASKQMVKGTEARLYSAGSNTKRRDFQKKKTKTRSIYVIV